VTQFQSDGRNPVQELNSSNGVTANLLTRLNIDEYFTRTASGATSTLLTDALGSTVGLVGSGGTIGTSYTYQPFGATTVAGSNANPYQFTGRENDATGLYFYRARYYHPTFQRFVTQDPIGFGGGDPNLYSYTRANPISLIDPSGLDVITLTFGINARAGLSAVGGPSGGGSGSVGIAISFPTPWNPSTPFDIKAVASKTEVQDYTGLKCGVEGSLQWHPAMSSAQQLRGTERSFQADVGFGGFEASPSDISPSAGPSAEFVGLGEGDVTTETQVKSIPGLSR
jgi:RHS repeat-associated protein